MSETQYIHASGPTLLNSSVLPASAVAQEAQRKQVAKLAEGAGIVMAGRFGGRGLRLVLDMVLARILGPVNFGLYAIGWTVLRIAGTFSPLGLDAGVIRYGARYYRRDSASLRGVIAQCLGVGTAVSLAVASGIFLGAPWLANALFHKPELAPVLRWFAAALPFVTAVRIAAAATRMSHRMKFAVLAEDVSQPLVDLLLVLVFYLAGLRLLGALAACLGSFVFALLLALRYLKRLFPDAVSAGKPVFVGNEIYSFSLQASSAGIFAVFLIWLDRLIVGYFRAAAEAGMYHAASQLSVAIAMTLSGFGAMFGPMIADFAHKGEMAHVEELFRVSTKWSLYLALPPALVACFVPRQVMTVLFGASYAGGWSALLILIVGQLINAGTGTLGAVLVMSGHQRAWLVASGSMMALGVAITCALTPVWGLAGAALGTAFAVGGLSVLGVILTQRALHISPYDRRYCKGAIAAAASVAALLGLRLLHIHSALLDLLAAACVTTAVFAATLLLLGLDDEDRQFIKLVRARIG